MLVVTHMGIDCIANAINRRSVELTRQSSGSYVAEFMAPQEAQVPGDESFESFAAGMCACVAWAKDVKGKLSYQCVIQDTESDYRAEVWRDAKDKWLLLLLDGCGLNKLYNSFAEAVRYAMKANKYAVNRFHVA